MKLIYIIFSIDKTTMFKTNLHFEKKLLPHNALQSLHLHDIQS